MSAPAQVALLGTGQVGRAVLARLGGWRGATHGAGIGLAYVANSRQAFDPVHARGTVPHLSATGPAAPLDALPFGPQGTRIVVDATASDAVADTHARWLAQGIHVVTACKLGQGTSLARWQAIRDGAVVGGTRYGDRATVGAGLPLLDTLRALRAGGDAIHAIAGVLSGSLGWLLDAFDGTRPFSALVREAHARGYTEPDPRDDLSGEDVRRKLLILARAAGARLEPGDITVAPLLGRDAAAPLEALDSPMRASLADACGQGGRLQYVARLARAQGAWHARVGLEALPPEDPLVGGRGSDNRVAIHSDRYRERPLSIQGPGAGPDVTAAALLDDVAAIVRQAAAPAVRTAPAPAARPRPARASATA